MSLMPTTAGFRRPRWVSRPALIPLLLAAWGIWLYHLAAGDLTFDEAATYYVAHRPLFEIVRYLLRASWEHPPVYYLLIHLWMQPAGTTEFGLRFFSVGVGLLTLPLVAVLTRRMSGLPGLAGAALLAVLPGMAYYARDARMYSLAAVWTLLAANLLFRLWLPPPGPRPTAVAALLGVNLLAVFTHYYLLLPVVVQPLTLLFARRRRLFLTWVTAHAAVLAGGLVWYLCSPGLQAMVHALAGGALGSLPPGSRVLRLLGKMVLSPVLGFSLQFPLYALLPVVLGEFLLLRRRRVAGLYLGLMLTVPLALAYLLPRTPVPRYLIFLLPHGALAAGVVGESPLLWGRRLGHRAAGVALTGALVWPLLSRSLFPAITYLRSDYGHVLRLVQAYARPGDGVLFYGPWQWIPFRYYDPGGLPPITTLPPQAPPLLKPEEAEPVLERLMEEHRRLWVLPAAVDDVDPEHFVYRWLAAHAHAVWRTAHFGLYLPPLPAGTPVRPLAEELGAVRLEGVAREPAPLLPGEPLRLVLLWRPVESLPANAVLSLELRDRRGHPWQTARSLPGENFSLTVGEVISDREGFLIPQGAPPGEYAVHLTLEAKGVVAGTDVLTVTVDDFVPVAGEPVGERRVYLPLVLRQGGEPSVARPAPVLYGLPFADHGAKFCRPDGTLCLRLAGYEPGGVRFQQGYPVPLTLHWLAPAGRLPELQARLWVTRKKRWPWSREAAIVTRTLPLAPTYPAPHWPPGRLVTLPLALTLPPDAPTGAAWVKLAVLGPEGDLWRTDGEEGALSLFRIEVEGRPVLRRLPAWMTPVEVDFGTAVGLRGYRLTGDPRPGGEVQVTYAWYARERPQAIYAVFNHLVTVAGETPVAQADSWPQGGRMLTTQWQAGEYILDEYRLAIPSDAPPGPYILYVGMYRAADGERLVAVEDGEQLPADRFPLHLEEVR